MSCVPRRVLVCHTPLLAVSWCHGSLVPVVFCAVSSCHGLSSCHTMSSCHAVSSCHASSLSHTVSLCHTATPCPGVGRVPVPHLVLMPRCILRPEVVMHHWHRVLMPTMCWNPWCPYGTPHPPAMLCPGAHRVLVPHPCAALCPSACHGLMVPTVAWFPLCPQATPSRVPSRLPHPGIHCVLMPRHVLVPHGVLVPVTVPAVSVCHAVFSHDSHPHGHRAPVPCVSSCLGTRRLVPPRPRPCHVASARPPAAPAGLVPLLGDSWWPPTQEAAAALRGGGPLGIGVSGAAGGAGGSWGLPGVPGGPGLCLTHLPPQRPW